jgi:hypothetical protein
VNLAPGKYEVRGGMHPSYRETTADYPYDFTVNLYAEDYIPIYDDAN